MRIGIIGAGNIGGNLGRRWRDTGHEVMFGLREPGGDRAREALARAPGARAVTVAEAAAFGEVVVLATPWRAAEEALRAAGDLSGKILVDTTNAVAPGFTLAVSGDSSWAERIAGWVPGAKVVKAFNTLGAEHLLDPRFGALFADVYLAGDDATAKETVAALARALGFEVIDAGPLASARLLEPLAMLWIRLAMVEGQGRNIAFKLLEKA